MLCTFDEDINQCTFYSREEKKCGMEASTCPYAKEENYTPTSKYVRQPRWYEKYYEGKSRPIK